MGSGKTTIGRRLASALARHFVDTDARLESTSGRTVREIFESDGEIAFRDMESETLLDTLSSPTPLVVATGGGAVLRDANRVALSTHDVIWLRAEPAVLQRRVGRTGRRPGGHRPLIDVDPLGTLKAMSEERRPLYEAVARFVIDVDRRRPEEITGICLAHLAGGQS